jgi:hypothetical protein
MFNLNTIIKHINNSSNCSGNFYGTHHHNHVSPELIAAIVDELSTRLSKSTQLMQ